MKIKIKHVFQSVAIANLFSALLFTGDLGVAQENELPPSLSSQTSPTAMLIEQSLQQDVSAILFSLRGPSAVSLGYPINSDPFWFVRLDPITRELKLTKKQFDLLAKMEDDFGSKIYDKNMELNQLDASNENFLKQASAMQKQIEQLIAQRESALEGVLDAGQNKRLDELVLQIQFLVGKDVNTLTSDQLSTILKIDESQKKQLLESAKEIDKEFQQEYRALVERTRVKLRSRLTATQRESLQALLGKPFDFGQLDWNSQQSSGGNQ